MDTLPLIDSVVRQTTVLIAQLSTAAGIRAPLAHVADQVFLSLASEIEAQGVGRKVVADMFGMALRAYQKKVQRLTESASVRDRTLWEAVLDFVTAEGRVMRSRVLERFRNDGERETIAVLTDLVNSGLVYATGRGATSLYGVTSDDERRHLSAEASAETRLGMVWGVIYRSPGVSVAEVAATLSCQRADVDEALDKLVREGRVERTTQNNAPAGDDRLHAANLLIPVGAAAGWEAAVFDHFQAVTTAIGAKLDASARRSQSDDVVGGATLRFQLQPGHPFEARVLGLLERVRRDLGAVWKQTSEYNSEHPNHPDRRYDVCFYFGQNVTGMPLAANADPGASARDT